MNQYKSVKNCTKSIKTTQKTPNSVLNIPTNTNIPNHDYLEMLKSICENQNMNYNVIIDAAKYFKNDKTMFPQMKKIEAKKYIESLYFD